MRKIRTKSIFLHAFKKINKKQRNNLTWKPSKDINKHFPEEKQMTNKYVGKIFTLNTKQRIAKQDNEMLFTITNMRNILNPTIPIMTRMWSNEDYIY